MTTLNLVQFTELTANLQQSIIEATAQTYLENNQWMLDFEAGLIRPALELLGFHNAVIDYSLDYSHHRELKLVSADFKYNTGMVAKMKKAFPSHKAFNKLAVEWLEPNKKSFYGYTFCLKGGYINDLEHDRLGNEFRHNIEPFEEATKAFLKELNRELLDIYSNYYDHMLSSEALTKYLLDNCQFEENGNIHWN